MPLLAQPAHVAADLGRGILDAGLDTAQCYRVRDLEISEEDARFFLTDGYIMFGKPVNGAPLTAVFSADTDGGDAEVLLLPPDRSERKSMAAYTGAPNLSEHFAQAAFIFTESSARGLLERVRASGARNSPDIGALMQERWGRVVTNLVSGFETRLVLDLLTPGEQGFFEAVIDGKKLGNFDVLYDSRSAEQLVAGQITTRKDATFWDTWTSFVSRSHRGEPEPAPEEQILSYKIDAALDPSLNMHCITRVRVRATEQSRNLLAFDLSGKMRVTSAKVDGRLAEFYERDSVRNGLVQNNGNELLLVLPDKPLEPGTEHDIEIAHEGKVVIAAGHDVYFVSARGTWYPGRGLQFANYDVTYRYPASLDLVAAGQVKEDRVEGDTHITRRVPENRLRLLGYNLGRFERTRTERNGITVEVLANKEVEDALRPRAPQVDTTNLDVRPRRRGPPTGVPEPPSVAPPPLHPANQLGRIADQVEDAMNFYRQKFGEPLIHHIEVSPLPGTTGQGFGGIIYLPTVNYLTSDTSSFNKDQGFFRDLLVAHEVAHQWWGNIVTTGSYHHEWIMEALSNYSALMYMETRVGSKGTETALELYRHNLFLKGPDGETAESEGPVVQGRRLEGSNNPTASVAVIYGKGSWIMHMLRRRMGDERFFENAGGTAPPL